MQKVVAPEAPRARARRLTAEARANTGKATTVAALKAEVARLAEVLELVQSLLDERT